VPLPSEPDPRKTTVVVTGASSGIGEAVAAELAARGYGLSLVARRRERLRDIAARLKDAHGVTVRTHAFDLAEDEHRDRLLAQLERDRREVIGLVNNAGTGAFGRVADHDPAEETNVVRTNLLALHDLTVRVLPGLIERGGGAILNVGSILGFAPIPQNATYAATKAFIASFSESLHTELAGTGVSCTVVHPGPTRTAVFAESGAQGLAGRGPGLFWQDPEEVARAGVDAMARGGRSVIPGWTNKLAVLGLRNTLRTPFLPLARAAQSAPVRRLLTDDGER